jgi:hypothetical protein
VKLVDPRLKAKAPEKPQMRAERLENAACCGATLGSRNNSIFGRPRRFPASYFPRPACNASGIAVGAAGAVIWWWRLLPLLCREGRFSVRACTATDSENARVWRIPASSVKVVQPSCSHFCPPLYPAHLFPCSGAIAAVVALKVCLETKAARWGRQMPGRRLLHFCVLPFSPHNLPVTPCPQRRDAINARKHLNRSLPPHSISNVNDGRM